MPCFDFSFQWMQSQVSQLRTWSGVSNILLLVPGQGRLILWKNKASWNLVLVEGIRVSVEEFSMYLPLTYSVPVWGVCFGVESNEFVIVTPLVISQVSGATLLLVLFDPCKRMAALATTAPRVAGLTFSFWLSVYLTGCSTVHPHGFRKAKKRAGEKVSG